VKLSNLLDESTTLLHQEYFEVNQIEVAWKNYVILTKIIDFEGKKQENVNASSKEEKRH
jgi:hypothetical protein